MPTHSLAPWFGTKQAHSRGNRAASPQEICAYRAPALEPQHESKKPPFLFHGQLRCSTQNTKIYYFDPMFAHKLASILVSWQVRVHNCPLSYIFFSISVALVLYFLYKKNLLKFDFKSLVRKIPCNKDFLMLIAWNANWSLIISFHFFEKLVSLCHEEKVVHEITWDEPTGLNSTSCVSQLTKHSSMFVSDHSKAAGWDAG